MNYKEERRALAKSRKVGPMTTQLKLLPAAAKLIHPEGKVYKAYEGDRRWVAFVQTPDGIYEMEVLYDGTLHSFKLVKGTVE